MPTKKDTIKLSCYLDSTTYETFKEKALRKGLSVSAYLRFLIIKNLDETK